MSMTIDGKDVPFTVPNWAPQTAALEATPAVIQHLEPPLVGREPEVESVQERLAGQIVVLDGCWKETQERPTVGDFVRLIQDLYGLVRGQICKIIRDDRDGSPYRLDSVRKKNCGYFTESHLVKVVEKHSQLVKEKAAAIIICDDEKSNPDGNLAACPFCSIPVLCISKADGDMLCDGDHASPRLVTFHYDITAEKARRKAKAAVQADRVRHCQSGKRYMKCPATQVGAVLLCSAGQCPGAEWRSGRQTRARVERNLFIQRQRCQRLATLL